MPFNIINDSWIPVVRSSGSDRIKPAQIAEADVLRFDWPRPDLNLACMEMLIGLIHMADPPRSLEDWEERDPDPRALAAALGPFSRAFALDGDGPRFQQDLEDLPGKSNAPDMLFIDSAGGQTATNNADLVTRRGRYPALSLPIAAMALQALQAFAPSGGSGNRTSMRGGGPMITLVQPQRTGPAPLWRFLWANTPAGAPLEPNRLEEALPWMRRTRTSEKGELTQPPEMHGTPNECFFGMPRRLRLVFAEDRCAITGEEGPAVVGVIQRPRGTNYGEWLHPLTPYYRQKAGDPWLPVHPKAGTFGYRNWLGILFTGGRDDRRPATVVQRHKDSAMPGDTAGVLVAGWAMDNMKPLDFVWSEQPLFTLTPAAEGDALGLVTAAEQVGYALAVGLRAVLGGDELDKGAVAREREAFFEATQPLFETLVGQLASGAALDEISEPWRRGLREEALSRFDALARPGLADRSGHAIPEIVRARQMLLGTLNGYTKGGRALFSALGLEPPQPKKAGNKEAAA